MQSDLKDLRSALTSSGEENATAEENFAAIRAALVARYDYALDISTEDAVELMSATFDGFLSISPNGGIERCEYLAGYRYPVLSDPTRGTVADVLESLRAAEEEADKI